MTLRRTLITFPALALIAGLTACGSSSSGGNSPSGQSSGASGKITVANAGFTESNLLAQMYADLLDKAGFTTSIKSVGSQEIFQSSLESGAVAIVPEYAATYADSLQTEVTGTQTPDAGVPSLSQTLSNLEKYASQKGLTHLQPAKAVDQNAFAVTKAFATQHHLTTLSDLGRSGVPVKLGAPAECPKRPFCEPGLKKTYGINISGLSTFDFDSLPVKQALKTGKVQLGEVATTDATLGSFGLVALQDDKHLQNADYLVPIVNKKVLAAHPQIATAINPLANVLTTQDLANLDNQADGQRQTVQDVAKNYLQSKGLI